MTHLHKLIRLRMYWSSSKRVTMGKGINRKMKTSRKTKRMLYKEIRVFRRPSIVKRDNRKKKSSEAARQEEGFSFGRVVIPWGGRPLCIGRRGGRLRTSKVFWRLTTQTGEKQQGSGAQEKNN